MVEWINTTHAENPDALVRAQWDGDVIVIIDPEYADNPGYQPDRVSPDTAGRYGIGAGAWCWFEHNG